MNTSYHAEMNKLIMMDRILSENDFSVFKINRMLCLYTVMLVVSPSLQALDAISNDPTKAQQPIDLPVANDNKDKAITLPEPTKPVPVPSGASTVEIKQILFDGNSVFSSKELMALVQDYLNRPIRASDFEAIRLKVTQYYVDKGYISSGAQLSNQSVADGILRLKIVEGRLVNVRQSGQERLRAEYIADRLILGSGEPLNISDLQDSYRRLLNDPLIQQMNGRLLPGVHPGEAILDVQVKRNRPYQLYAGADDYSTPAVGGYTGRMGGWVDNLLTLGERLDGQFIVTGGGLGYNIGINIPVSAYDTRVSFRFSDVTSTLVETPFNTLNLTTHITGFDGGISQPVYRTINDNLSLGLNFVVRESRTLMSNSCDLGANFTGVIGDSNCNNQVSVLRMSQRATHKGQTNSLAFYSTFSTGLNVLGATTLQAGGQGGEFFSWLGQSMFSQQIWDNGTFLAAKANIQLANSPLLPLERFSVGGINTVRGYRENTYIRDNGFNSTLEIKYPIYANNTVERDSLYLVPFVDYGGAWNNTSSLNPSMPTNYLFSNGIGFNWQYKQVSTDFYWAHAYTPVIPAPSSHSIQDNGIHFRVNFTAF